MDTYENYCRWAIPPLMTREQWEYSQRVALQSVRSTASQIVKGDIVSTDMATHGTALEVRQTARAVHVTFAWGAVTFRHDANVWILKTS